VNFSKAVGWRLLAVSQTRLVGILFSVSALTLTSRLQADTFGSGSNAFDIAFVTIGNPGNPADTTGQPNPAGSVPYLYRIGKYEISEQMIDKANALGGLGITKDTRGLDKPATSVSWFEAAQFVNWLNTSTGHTPAYKFDAAGDFQLWTPSDPGYNPNNLFRNDQAEYFLPSADEWYKAAFYDPASGTYWDYPTGSNSPPIPVASGTAPRTAVVLQGELGPADITQAGGLSPFGTTAQGGNVNEWEESALDLSNDEPLERRGGRGGNWGAFPSDLSATLRSAALPFSDGPGAGFRIARAVPEPNVGVFVNAVFGWLLTRRRFLRRCYEVMYVVRSSTEAVADTCTRQCSHITGEPSCEGKRRQGIPSSTA
jgi:hypothetical protein